MLKNYTPKEYRTVVDHSLVFNYDRNSGFSFPCDANGNVNISNLNPCAARNLNECMAHPEKFQDFAKVETNRWRVSDPAHGTCECGEEVYLYDEYMGACECPNCGRWYNLFGQELNPPSSWADGDDW